MKVELEFQRLDKNAVLSYGVNENIRHVDFNLLDYLQSGTKFPDINEWMNVFTLEAAAEKIISVSACICNIAPVQCSTSLHYIFIYLMFLFLY